MKILPSYHNGLKSVLLQETPWVLQAKSENEAKHTVGLLFERARLKRELSGAIKKLTDLQRGDGSWPWFPGGRTNDFLADDGLRRGNRLLCTTPGLWPVLARIAEVQ